MRYNEDGSRLYLSVGELIAITRRGIARAGFDRDFPSGDMADSLSLELEICGQSVILYGRASVSGDVITLVKEVEARAGKPTRTDREDARGVGFLLCYILMSGGVTAPALRVVYTDKSGEVILDEAENPSEISLRAFFEKCINTASIYARPEIERVTKRKPAFKSAKFPYRSIRDGQKEFIRAAYRALCRGTQLYTSAPTGTGKTVSVLYPAIKALGEGKCDKVFYLTPKHTTADAARDCLKLFKEQGVDIKAVCLYSKESLCTEGLACRRISRSCRFGEMKRLPDAVLSLYELGETVVTRRDILRASTEFSVCPHELALAYSELCDVVICDFNYLYDPQVYIKRYFTEGGRYALLVDEAHNLPDRTREMYSEELSLSELDRLLLSPLLPEHSPLRTALGKVKDGLYSLLFPYVKEELRRDAEGKEVGATHLSELPEGIFTLIGTLYAAAEEAHRRSLRENDEDAEARAALLSELSLKLKKLSAILDIYDRGYKIFIFYEGGVLRFKLFCIDTGGVIAARTALCYGAIFFSATLEPIDYYRSLLGADGSQSSLSVSSPFDPSQLSVSIVDRISTRYSERGRTLPAVCRTVAAVMSARRGNYMVFCPSFEYLEILSQAFIEKFPKLHVLVQRRDMTAGEKSEFLEAFKASDGKYLVGFCVLGGIYSEGVDLTGDSLIGAVVVGIGMPQLSYEREAMREYFGDKYEAGTEYAYLYPGMNKVFQAAGRVIRTENDRGVIVLIDDRFRDPIYKKSIPALWHGMKYVGDAKELKERIEGFWRRVDEERK